MSVIIWLVLSYPKPTVFCFRLASARASLCSFDLCVLAVLGLYCRTFSVAVSRGSSLLGCVHFPLGRLLSLQSVGSRVCGRQWLAHGLSCPEACGIFPDQGSNPCPLHWQAGSHALYHQGSPSILCTSPRTYIPKKQLCISKLQESLRVQITWKFRCQVFLKVETER